MQAGRNDPCPCRSGKKYKKCCLNSSTITSLTGDLLWRQLGQIHDDFAKKLLEHGLRYFGSYALEEAWEEFWVWESKKPFSPDGDGIENQLFMPFFLYNWLPDDETHTNETIPEDTTIGFHYLEKRRGYLSSLEQHFLEASLDAPFSFHDVVAVNPGQGFRLRDIFLGTEVDVTERSGSKGTQIGDILFAKIIQIDHVGMACGMGWIRIPPARKHEILELRQELREIKGTLTTDVLHEFDIELRELFLDLQESLMAPPRLYNTDKEEMIPHQITYEIDSAQEAFDALKDLAHFETEEEMLEDAEYGENDELKKVLIVWHKSGNAMHKEWENTVMGRLEIDGNKLKIQVNSANRADLIRKEVEKRLGSQARHQGTVLQSIEALMREREEESSRHEHSEECDHVNEQEELMKNPEIQAQVRTMMEKHWENWFDQKIPALGDRTPREAAQDPDGREMLEALLLDYQRKDGRTNVPYQPDWQKMRERLGLTSQLSANHKLTGSSTS